MEQRKIKSYVQVLCLQVAKEYMSMMKTPVVRARLEAGARPPSLSGESNAVLVECICQLVQRCCT